MRSPGPDLNSVPAEYEEEVANSTNYGASHYAVFFILLLLSLSAILQVSVIKTRLRGINTGFQTGKPTR
jgi:hypothetical protein